jgi:PAS domain-containing protein
MTREEIEVELIDFFENAPISLHWLGSDGNIIWANKRELETLGYTAEEYIGHSVLEFCPDEVRSDRSCISDLPSMTFTSCSYLIPFEPQLRLSAFLTLSSFSAAAKKSSEILARP